MKITRTTEGLRDMLFNELESFLSGEVTGEHVKVVTKVTQSIISTVSTDLEAAKLLRQINEGRDQPRSIADLNLNLLLTHSENTVIKSASQTGVE